MTTILEALRTVLGEADFIISSGSYTSYDYAAMIEYFVGAVIVCIVVSSVFKIIVRWFS